MPADGSSFKPVGLVTGRPDLDAILRKVEAAIGPSRIPLGPSRPIPGVTDGPDDPIDDYDPAFEHGTWHSRYVRRKA